MSKTDKTKPFWVKLMHGDLAVEESHDHSDGPCDLPGPDVAESYGWWPSQARCRRSFVYTGIHTCCCSLCHSSGGSETRPQKKRRMEGRRACRDWEREYDESWIDPVMWVDNGGYAGAWNMRSWYDDDWRDELDRAWR
jgi:hypothetical protein